MNLRNPRAETRFILVMAVIVAIILGFALYGYFFTGGWN
jgi:Mg2+ and Co2+ transporter CorA